MFTRIRGAATEGLSKLPKMLTLNSLIQNLQKLTKPQHAALKKLGLKTVNDLLMHFPYRYLDFSKIATIGTLHPGQAVSLKVAVKNISSRFSFRGRLSLAEAVVSDSTGSLKVVWFNQSYLAKTIKPGDILYLAGTPNYYKNTLQLTNPIYENETDFPVHTARLVPVYHLTENLYPKTLRNLIARALPAAKLCQDILPETILANLSLPGLTQTMHYAHFPETLEQSELAKKRLAFEEIFISQLAAQKTKLELLAKSAHAIAFNQKLVKTFVDSLPFQLTAGQKQAAWEILQDMEKPVPMNRLVEGDVGSGKTLVALIAALEAAQAGCQVAFLAPTEILARQHAETVEKFTLQCLRGRANTVNFKNVLLTNHYSKINGSDEKKSKIQKLISKGMSGLYIGTHALLAEKINFPNLALVIIDEQHRFGVKQRAQLTQLPDKVPHLLSLSATPIPRTLQLAMYGELEISQIKSKPPGRKPIITKLVKEEERQVAYNFINREIEAGRQAFVITPLIEESDILGIKAAKIEAEALKKIFPQLSIGLMHGKLKGAEKESVMKEFLDKKYHILVSTSVVEVGVDVPNATIMLIEGAERFGLAQLHQFRGRVGRSQFQSYCMLFPSQKNETSNTLPEKSNSRDEQQERLNAFTKTQDGFALAELDLKLRGFGELYGSQQSGWNFKYFSGTYLALIEPARQAAKQLLENNPQLKNYPLLSKAMEDKIIHFE